MYVCVCDMRGVQWRSYDSALVKGKKILVLCFIAELYNVIVGRKIKSIVDALNAHRPPSLTPCM